MTYLRLGIAVAGLLALIGAFFYGSSVGAAQCEAAHLRADKAAREQREKSIRQAQTDDAAAAELDARRETIVREITREVPRIVERPVYRGVCADADGLRVLDRAVEAANGGAATGRPLGDPADLLEAARGR